MNIDETIDTFRLGALSIDCKHMVLRQRKGNGAVYEGPGYIRQTDEGGLIFKLYATKHDQRRAIEHFNVQLQGVAGQLHGPELLYDLTALAHGGTTWTATLIVPALNWDVANDSVIVGGAMHSMLAELERPTRATYYLRLHFFSEYDVPILHTSPVQKHGQEYLVRDRAEFDACKSRFEVRKRDGAGETTVKATSESPFPTSFDLRIQEALQYLTGKSAFYRARIERRGEKLSVELISPGRTSSHTHLDPPLSPVSPEYRQCAWDLFASYLTYVVAHTDGPHWNPVAYHLYNACESSSSSLDAWAVGISVAVEAVANLIDFKPNPDQTEKLADFRDRLLRCIDAQTDLKDLQDRMRGLIGMTGQKRPQDVLYALVKTGNADEAYVKAWAELRNRHVHPNPKDLKTPQAIDYQELFDRIHRAEVVLRQLTFYLIGYAGPYTDYGAPNFPSRTYPQKPAGPASTWAPDEVAPADTSNPPATSSSASTLKRTFAMAFYASLAALPFAFINALGRLFSSLLGVVMHARFSAAAGYTVMFAFLTAVAALIFGVSVWVDKALFDPLEDRPIARRLQKAALILGLVVGGLLPLPKLP